MTTTATAAVIREPHGQFSLETVELDDLRSDEILVRIEASGVCHTDKEAQYQNIPVPLPVVLGHEGAGVVEAVGENVTTLKPGDNVVLNWAPNCGECFSCLHDVPNLCQALVGPLWRGTLMDGTSRLSKNTEVIYHLSGLSTLAKKAVAPQEACISIRKDIPLQHLSSRRDQHCFRRYALRRSSPRSHFV